MKNKRHEKILELIVQYDIETQDELAGRLIDAGFEVTQATVSRDINKLDLVKVKGESGHQKYTVRSGLNPEENKKYVRVLQDAIKSMEDAQNILVIRTVSGMAMAVAAALDAMNLREVVGSIAGDDTIMMAIRTEAETKIVMDKIREIL